MSKRIKAILLVLPIVVVIAGVSFFKIKDSFQPSLSSVTPQVILNESIVEVMVADEAEEWWQGLSDRPSLDANQGMLFIFDQKSVRSFWMRRMNFPLDIIWIDGDTVVKIDKFLAPEGDQPDNKYSSDFPVNIVLEVNAGWSDAHGLEIGDKLIYKL